MPRRSLLKDRELSLDDGLQSVLDAAAESLCGLDEAGQITFCNQAFLRMFDYEFEEVSARRAHDLLHRGLAAVNTPAATDCFLQKLLKSGQPAHVSGEIVYRKDETHFPAECWVQPLKSPFGATTTLLTIRNLSSTVRDPKARGRHQVNLEKILANVPDVAWTTNERGHTIYISPKVETVMGYAPDEIYAGGPNLWLGRIHEEDLERVRRGFAALFENEGVFDEEYRIRRKDESWIWVHDRATATREEDGSLYADGIFSDISRRKRAELELEAKTAFLEANVRSAIDGTLVVNPENQRILLNESLINLFSIPAVVAAEPNSFVLFDHLASLVRDPVLFLSGFRSLAANPSETSQDEIELVNGGILERRSSPVVDHAGGYYGRIWTFRDITERKRNEDELQQLFMAVEQSPVSVIITDPKGKIGYANRKFTEITGYIPAEVIGKTPAILRSGQTPEHVYRTIWSTITQAKEWRGELSNQKKNGEIYWDSVRITPITNTKGEITHYVSIQEDVTDRKQAEKELRLAQFSVEHASDAVFWVNSEARILYANRTACASLGYSREELVQFYISDIAPDLPRHHWAAFWQKLKERTYKTFESRHITKGRKIFPVEVSVNYREFAGKEYCFAFVRDITQRKIAEEQVQTLAYFDVLTGLPNRMLLRDRLTQSLAAARREEYKLAVIFLDLDRFKYINDTLGHSAGDLVLQETTRRLIRTVRDQDTVARLGGDEFVVVLSKIKDVHSVSVAAQRFMEAMAPDFQIQGTSIGVSCSLGISIYPDHGADSESLIKNADTAMYCAKEGGRNNFQIFGPEINAQAVERLTIEKGLRLALERKEFFLVYQPQVEITSGKIVGLESLLRWRHPEVGLVPPDDFIRVAENCGLIVPIGTWVLRTACEQARKWQDAHFAPVSIAVNVSAVQFRQEGFPKIIRDILQETRVDPRYLELEITESLLLSNADVMFSILREIQSMGLKLSIDDFGTGYSSLSYLKQFPVSKLKIDRSFIRDVAVNPDDAAITTAIISMAKSLNLKVIAEGVETEEQMSFLRAHHCDEMQGYYFSKPMTVEEVAAKLRSHDTTLRKHTAGSKS